LKRAAARARVTVWSFVMDYPYLACPLTMGFALFAPFGAVVTYGIPRRPPHAKGLQRSFIPFAWVAPDKAPLSIL
jgi:uncharacterized membrane protein